MQSIEPTDSNSDLNFLLCQAFCLAVSAKAVVSTDWMNLPKVWHDLKSKAESIQDIFTKGQIILALAIVSAKRRKTMLQSVIELSDDLVQQDACKSSQLLIWAIFVTPAERLPKLVEKLETHVRQIVDPLDKGIKLAFTSSIVDVCRRGPLLCDAMDALMQVEPDKSVAYALRDLSGLVDACNHVEASKNYKSILESVPVYLAPVVRGESHYAIEECKRASGTASHCDVLLLTARLRDILTSTQSCFTLNDETILWQTVSGCEKQLRDLAKAKLKEKTLCGYLDLSLYSALVLESLLLMGDEFALEILPYMRCLELDAICVLKRWVCDSRLGLLEFDRSCRAEVRDLANMLLAEEQGLDISNTSAVIKLLKSDIDICRRRSEALLNDYSCLYHSFCRAGLAIQCRFSILGYG